MKFNKLIAAMIVAVVLLASSPLILRSCWPRINAVETGQTPQYPELQPQRFNQPPERVFVSALDVVHSMGWDIIEKVPETGVIEAVATSRFLRVKDEVTITIGREGEVTVVKIRSRSRAGKKGDFGSNARRIRAFQAELAKRL